MRFKWNLQKVLDVRKTQEQILKSELFKLTQQQLNIQQKIILLQMQIRTSASKLKALPFEQRISNQSSFLSFSFKIENDIESFNNKLQEMEKQKQKKLQEHIQARKSRKSLEKLKEKKYQEFMYRQNKAELNFLDDLVNTKSARERMGL